MSHSPGDFPISWEYPSTGPAPPTPKVVNTVPVYIGGVPTPQPTPSRPACATRTEDDYMPCPPTPRYVPSDADEGKWSNKLDLGTFPLSLSELWSTPELGGSTCFADLLTANESDDQDPYDVTPHVSDSLIYARENYAYPSPVLAIIQRAELDQRGLTTRRVDSRGCKEPFKLFSLTAGNIPTTGLKPYDEESFEYYLYCSASPLNDPGYPQLDLFSIGTIQALQQELCVKWRWVYPEPILPVIVRLHDLVGPYNLKPRDDGCGYIVPTENSIWDVILQRGVDSDFRPRNSSATVETDICRMGAALYHPQHIVASRFAMNVFLEIPNSEGQAPTPLCKYLGAFVLQVSDGLTLQRAIWRDIDPDVKRSVFDRVPHLFGGRKRAKYPWRCLPRLPHVRFCYYQWDQCLLGLANEFRNRDILSASRPTVRQVNSNISHLDRYLESIFNTGRHANTNRSTTSGPNVSTPVPKKLTSFLDLL